MGDRWIVVSGYCEGEELYKKVLTTPNSFDEFIKINNDLAANSQALSSMLQQNPPSAMILTKVQQKFKCEDIDTFVDMPSQEIFRDEFFKPEYLVRFSLAVRSGL